MGSSAQYRSSRRSSSIIDVSLHRSLTAAVLDAFSETRLNDSCRGRFCGNSHHYAHPGLCWRLCGTICTCRGSGQEVPNGKNGGAGPNERPLNRGRVRTEEGRDFVGCVSLMHCILLSFQGRDRKYDTFRLKGGRQKDRGRASVSNFVSKIEITKKPKLKNNEGLQGKPCSSINGTWPPCLACDNICSIYAGNCLMN